MATSHAGSMRNVKVGNRYLRLFVEIDALAAPQGSPNKIDDALHGTAVDPADGAYAASVRRGALRVSGDRDTSAFPADSLTPPS